MKGLARIVIFQRCQDLLLNLDRMASFMSSLQVSYEQLLFFFFFLMELCQKFHHQVSNFHSFAVKKIQLHPSFKYHYQLY